MHFINKKKISQEIDKKIIFYRDAEEYPVIGLDCQWTTGFGRNPVALLQVSSHKGNVVLIRLSKSQIPHDLGVLLYNPKIIKSGLETLKDAQYLFDDYSINVKGTFDLRYLAEDMGHRPESLSNLAKKILNRDIGRELSLVASDWDAETLSHEQIKYAEMAAQASVNIFKELFQYAVDIVNKNSILSYCNDKLDKRYVYYSQKWNRNQ